MSELEAATGEKKGGGDVSGVRDKFCFLGIFHWQLYNCEWGERYLLFFRHKSLAIVHLYYCERGEILIIVFCAYFIGNCVSLLSSNHDAQNLLSPSVL